MFLSYVSFAGSASLQESRGLRAAFQVDAPRGNEAVAAHVDDGLRLFERKITDEWFIDAVFGMHLDEQHFRIDRPEAFDLDPRGAAHLSSQGVLRGRLD